MTTNLVDTSILIDLARGFKPSQHWLAQVQGDILISALSVGELIEGCTTKAEIQRQMKDIQGYRVAYASERAQKLAIDICANYFPGSNIGFIDSLIAATALDRDLDLVTLNVKHFKVVPGLRIVRPY